MPTHKSRHFITKLNLHYTSFLMDTSVGLSKLHFFCQLFSSLMQLQNFQKEQIDLFFYTLRLLPS